MFCCRLVFSLIGRICLSLVFLLGGIFILLDWQEFLFSFEQMMTVWAHQIPTSKEVHEVVQFMITYAPVFLGVSAALELIGGLMVLIGINVRLGALLLLIYFIPITIIAHPFWIMDAANYDYHLMRFISNVAIMGGVFLCLAFGSGYRQNSSG